MKKIFFLALCVVCVAASLAGETLMVSVGTGVPGILETTEYRFCFSAIEDGLMGELFLAGHIVFNDAGFRSSPERAMTLRRARDGGAVRVVFVDCVYEAQALTASASGKIVVAIPAKISIAYIDARDGGEITEKEFLPAEKPKPPRMPMEDYYALLGKEAAKYILSQ
ncbi:MAG: hypothetical protein LBC67_07910 [Spirochaetales bacterium]|jgi:hypothetical protein|nr:hypothetical protein [Spirochaetales bacterium]